MLLDLVIASVGGGFCGYMFWLVLGTKLGNRHHKGNSAPTSVNRTPKGAGFFVWSQAGATALCAAGLFALHDGSPFYYRMLYAMIPTARTAVLICELLARAHRSIAASWHEWEKVRFALDYDSTEKSAISEVVDRELNLKIQSGATGEEILKFLMHAQLIAMSRHASGLSGPPDLMEVAEIPATPAASIAISEGLENLFVALGPPPEATEMDLHPVSRGDGGTWS